MADRFGLASPHRLAVDEKQIIDVAVALCQFEFSDGDANAGGDVHFVAHTIM